MEGVTPKNNSNQSASIHQEKKEKVLLGWAPNGVTLTTTSNVFLTRPITTKCRKGVVGESRPIQKIIGSIVGWAPLVETVEEDRLLKINWAPTLKMLGKVRNRFYFYNCFGIVDGEHFFCSLIVIKKINKDFLDVKKKDTDSSGCQGCASAFFFFFLRLPCGALQCWIAGMVLWGCHPQMMNLTLIKLILIIVKIWICTEIACQNPNRSPNNQLNNSSCQTQFPCIITTVWQIPCKL